MLKMASGHVRKIEGESVSLSRTHTEVSEWLKPTQTAECVGDQTSYTTCQSKGMGTKRKERYIHPLDNDKEQRSANGRTSLYLRTRTITVM